MSQQLGFQDRKDCMVVQKADFAWEGACKKTWATVQRRLAQLSKKLSLQTGLPEGLHSPILLKKGKSRHSAQKRMVICHTFHFPTVIWPIAQKQRLKFCSRIAYLVP